MGVDAGMFAKNAKKYFWFDRLSNIENYWEYPDEILDDAYRIKSRLMDKNNSLSTNDIVKFLDLCVAAWESREESQRYHADWVRGIIRFVQAHPNDQFFVSQDGGGDAYDLIGEMNGERGIWKGEYMEWKDE